MENRTNPENRTKALTESGILAATMVVLAMTAVYVPLLGVMAALVWPLPATVLVVRHGLRWGAMATVVAAAIISMLIEPTIGVRMAIAFGPTGLALGYGARMKMSAVKTLTTSMVLSVAAKIAGLALVAYLTGVAPFSGQLEAMQASFGDAVAMYEKAGMTEAQIEAARESFMTNIKLVSQLLPLVVVIMGLFDTAVNFFVLGKILPRIGGGTAPTLPPFSRWRLSVAFPYAFAFSLFGMYWGQTHEIALLYQVSFNVYMAATIAGIIEGVSLYTYVTAYYRLPTWMKSMLLFFLLFTSFTMPMFIVVGLLDMAFDYRARYWRKAV